MAEVLTEAMPVSNNDRDRVNIDEVEVMYPMSPMTHYPWFMA